MLSADGCIQIALQPQTDCCAPPLCGNDLCCTFVAFMNQLPSGPLWDYWKAKAIEYFESHDDPAQCPLLKDPRCPSLVLHAIYAVIKLRNYVHGALWPALRESHPTTAVTTIDNYLERLRWEDCYAQHCRAVLLGDITPYEVIGDCGPIFCEPDFPDDLQCALKRNIAIALSRVNRGIIRNLCSLNWVIEPLGAILAPHKPIGRNAEDVAEWNPNDIGEGLVITNGVSLSSTISGPSPWRTARSIRFFTTGKRYFEWRIDARTAAETIGVGIAQSNVPLEGEMLGLKNSIAMYDTSYVYKDYGAGGSRKLIGRPLTTGEWGRCAVDLTAGKIWFGDLSGWDGDPASGVDPTFTFTPGHSWFAAANLEREGDYMTANFGINAYAYPIPAGFLSWGIGRCDGLCAPNMKLDIFPARDWLEGCGSGDVCDTLKPLPRVTAYWDRGCDKPAGLPDRIWPGILAAECIVRSLLPSNCPSVIIRRC